jgi:hypothetical protein
MRLIPFVLLALAGCGSSDSIEVNKRLNFDVCNKQCAAAGTSLGTFEQGLGYVKCTCLSKQSGEK